MRAGHNMSRTHFGRRWFCFTVFLVLALPLYSQDTNPAPASESNTTSGTTIDRVVAVVNRQTILESDVQDEIQLAVLDPSTKGAETITPQEALDRLISRALIQQQIRQEDLPATEPNPQDIAARIEEIRTELPACLRAGCRTDDGWKTFLARHELSTTQVERYMHNRLEILSFIEMRFRQGIRITPEEIDQYYRETLLPQYPAGQKPPPLEQVSSRIEEILLQQKVNLLFDTWLTNLRGQGQIEVLDHSLAASRASGNDGATKE
jgi:peptidyl-prolyl cis-trans isomerase SurA